MTNQQITFPLTIDAQEMQVQFTPNYFTSFPVGHFEFRSPHEPSRRIPVSETGYRSHFAPMPEIEAAPSPEEYARALALAFFKANAALAANDAGDQLTLL